MTKTMHENEENKMEEIGSHCDHRVPSWVKHAEKKFRIGYHGDTYHGIPMNLEIKFNGKRYRYIVKYGDAIEMGCDPTITFYRKRKHNLIKRLIMLIQGKKVY